MDLKLGEVIKNITFISIILGCFGILISNIQANSFNLPVFEVLDTRVIYIGFVFSLFLLGHFLIYAMFFNYSNIAENNFLKVLIISIIKLIVVSSLVFIVLCYSDYKELTGGLTKFWANFLHFCMLASCFTIGIIGSAYVYIKKDKTLFTTIFFKIPLGLCLCASVFLFVYLLVRIPDFRDIVSFETYFLSLFLFGFGAIWAREKDLKKGVGFDEETYFSLDSRSRNFLDRLFIYFYAIIMILIMVNTYTKNIYKHIDRKKGGGKPEMINLYTNTENISGTLVLQTSKYIFIKQDSNIIKVDWIDLKKIKTKK